MRPENGVRLKELGVLGLRIPPARAPIPLRLMSVLGALIGSLFVLAYVALIPLAAWATYRVASGSGSVSLRSFSALFGGALILSLLKPLVAPSCRGADPHVLSAGEEPLLFDLVKEMSSSGGLPMPSHIAVDYGVNCHCVFPGGITGILRSGFVLVIGLPLATALRFDQFAGVLAHELGHAAQMRDIRWSRIAWSVHSWLSRVALERDQLDEQLLKIVVSGRAAARLASRVAQSVVLLGRAVLRLLSVAESAICSIVLRRAELEADRYQVGLAGTEAFISAVHEVNLLEVAAHRAVVELSGMKRQGRLVDNYPGLIAAIRGHYSEEFAQQLLSGLEQGKTGIFSLHPCDRDRIALARLERKPAILSTKPAALLFGHLASHCQTATLEFYKQELGIEPQGYNCVPLQDALSGRSKLR